MPVIEELYNKFCNYSMQKYSSNVIEKCFELSKESLPVFVNEMICSNRTLGNFIIFIKNF